MTTIARHNETRNGTRITPGEHMTIDGTRRATILHRNAHLDFWAVRYDDEPGVYYHVSASRISE